MELRLSCIYPSIFSLGVSQSNDCPRTCGISLKDTGKLAGTIHRRWHGPITRYAKLRVAHTPGMPGTFSPPPWVSDPDMHHGTCVTHVRWCMPGSLTRGFLWSGDGDNVPGIPGACATHNCASLVRGPCGSRFHDVITRLMVFLQWSKAWHIYAFNTSRLEHKWLILCRRCFKCISWQNIF